MLVKGNSHIDEPQAILLIQLGDIGDVVLTLPCIRALRENFPTARLVVAVRERARELLDGNPEISEVIGISQQKRLSRSISHQIRFWPQLRKQKIDLAIDMRTGTRGAILAFLSGARQRIGFEAQNEAWWRNRLFTNLFRPEPVPGIHIARYHLDLLAAYGITTSEMRPQLVIPATKQERIAGLLRQEGIIAGRPLVAVQPFSLWKYKEWSSENFIRLVHWLREEYDLQVLLCGSPGERQQAAALQERCGPGTYNLAGKTTLDMYAALLHACDLFIGVDSAGIHLAAAVDTPTVSIFGPSSPHSWAPIGEEHSSVFKKLECVPCCQKGCGNSERSRCLEELAVGDVAAAVRKRLGELKKN